MGKVFHRIDVMILAAANFLTGVARKFHGGCMRSFSLKVRGTQVGLAASLVIVGFFRQRDGSDGLRTHSAGSRWPGI